MSDEFQLEDEPAGDAPTMEITEDVTEDATLALDGEENMAISEEEVAEADEADAEEYAEEADYEDENVERRIVYVAEGPALGAFTGMLMVSAAAYAAALALVLYRLSEYSAVGAFPW